MIRAEVGWALRACHEEYTVLASGGRVPGLAGVFARFPAAAPSAGPRVTFGGVVEDRFEVMIQEWSRDIDAIGRPLPLSRYFSVPYAILSEGRIGYGDLYAALKGREPPPDGKELHVELPATSAQERTALVERFGHDRAAAAAALLLAGPVTVTRAGELSLEERLAFCDAVGALLPYGLRAGLVVSTGEGGDGLSFASRCAPGSAELDWQEPSPPAGNVYLARLAGLPPAKVVGHLAEQVEPLAGPGTAAALQMLDELDLPGVVLRAAREGRLSYDGLHRLFASGRFRELPSAEDRRYLFNELVARGNVEDLMVVEPLWAEAGGDFEVLVKAARAKLWQLEPELETVRYLWSAERLGFADAFLARLVRCPDPQKSLEGAPGGESAVARLVRTRSKGEYTLTFSALADNGPVLYELFHQLACDPEKDLDEWYERLKRFVPADLLVPFSRVLRGDGASVDTNALSRIVVRGPGCLKMLLRTAAAAGRLESVLPAFAALLARGTVPDRGFWSIELAELEPVHAGDQGVADGLLLLLDRPPRHLQSAAVGDWTRYQESFERLCALPGVAAPVITRLTAHLNTWSWQTDPRCVAAVLGLVSAREDVLELARVVLAGRAVEPALIEDEQYAAWRHRALTRLPQLAAEEVPLTLTCLRPEAEPELVARLCAEAIDRHVPLEVVVEHLTRSRWHLTGDRAVRLLNGIRHAFTLLGWSRREAEEFALALGRAVVRTLHPALVAEIREHTARETLLEIEYQYQLLQNVMMDPLDDEVLYLSDRTRGELEELAAWVLSLARSGRSRSWFG
ncbi:hypothetical protein [Actinocorallia populi]|uniref:hypothetical protein n=1 Tax=Actinocorallia populi TaxID=2079200 RepID=UPI000D08EA35|nr:hypothetical protein [Actinocorallia populi]